MEHNKIMFVLMIFCFVVKDVCTASQHLAPPASRNTISFQATNSNEGSADITLTDNEISFLTPQFDNTLDFWNSDWDKQHPNATKIYLIRHKESISNVPPTLTQNRNNFTPGTPHGNNQAVAMAHFLSPVHFNGMSASDSERAHTTLQKLWEIQGNSSPVPFDHRLAEVSLFPRGAVLPKVAIEVFDPEGLFMRYPHLFQNVHFESVPKIMNGLGDVYSAYTAAEQKGKTFAIGSHGVAIMVQLMVMGNLSPEKFHVVKSHVYPNNTGYPNVGISIVAYDHDAKQWELLVFKDNSYLPEKLQRGTEGKWRRKAVKMLYKFIALKRYVEFKLKGSIPHPIHRDYYPRGKYSWWWNLQTPDIKTVQKRHKAFHDRYPDREIKRTELIPNESS